MFSSLGMPELILILVIALMVFGPKQLPEVGKTLGKTLNDIRRFSLSGLDEIQEPDRKVKEEVKEEVKEKPVQSQATTITDHEKIKQGE